MLTLYYKPSCPFCQGVLGEVEDMGLKMNLRDIVSDSVAKEELIEKGGKKQVPFLVDAEKGVTMYESNDIIEYLSKNYGSNDASAAESNFNGVRIHKSDDTCESCQ